MPRIARPHGHRRRRSRLSEHIPGLGGDETHFRRELAEHALAHKVKGVERAYRRSDALKKRRKLMELWARYLDGDRGANVIAIGKAQR
jgi:hypothetical protein